MLKLNVYLKEKNVRFSIKINKPKLFFFFGLRGYRINL